jgi:hypothetical protein
MMRRWWWLLAVLAIMSWERVVGWPCLSVLAGVSWLGDQPRWSSVVKSILWTSCAAVTFALPWWLGWLFLGLAWVCFYTFERWITNQLIRWWLVVGVVSGVWWLTHQASLLPSSWWYVGVVFVVIGATQIFSLMGGWWRQPYQLDARFWLLKKDDTH